MDVELAKRLAAHERWEWMPGMRVMPIKARIVFTDGLAFVDGRNVTALYGRLSGDTVDLDVYPDLDDAATVGCLLFIGYEAAAGDDKLFDEGISRPTINHGDGVAQALLRLYEMLDYEDGMP